MGLAGLTPKELRAKLEKSPELKIFVRLEKSLDYLMNELDVVRPSGENDPSALRHTVGFDDHVNMYGDNPEEFEGTRFEFKNPDTGKYMKIESDKDLRELGQLLWKRLGGTLIHTERVNLDAKNSTSIEPLKKYIMDTIKMFVMKGIDTYFEAKEQGKVDLYLAHIKEPGACMEDQGSKFQLFEEKNLIEEEPLDQKQVEELNRIALQPIESDGPQLADKVICETMASIPGFDDMEEWDDKLADALKEKLVGKTCQMIELEKTDRGIKFKPIENLEGKPVIKKLTAEDIDILGPACFDNLNGL